MQYNIPLMLIWFRFDRLHTRELKISLDEILFTEQNKYFTYLKKALYIKIFLFSRTKTQNNANLLVKEYFFQFSGVWSEFHVDRLLLYLKD